MTNSRRTFEITDYNDTRTGIAYVVVDHVEPAHEGDGLLPPVYVSRRGEDHEVGDTRVTTSDLREWALLILATLDREDVDTRAGVL